MSIKYSIIESFSGNHKKKLCQLLEKHEIINDVPSWCYKKYDVEKKGEENPVFIIKSKKAESKKALLYVYGGCGLLSPSKRHFKMACALADSLGAAVYFPFYPLAPQNNVRFALRWLQKVYADVLKDWSAKKVIFVGDGYGANLAISLCYRVVGRPAKLVLISPAVGLDNNSGLENRKAAEQNDKIMSVEADNLIAANWFKNVKTDSSDADPLCVDCTGFPPVYIFYGTKEIYYQSVENLISKLDGKVHLDSYKRKMCHCWPLLQNVSEGKKAVKQIRVFAEKEYGPVQGKVVVPEENENSAEENSESES